MSKREVRGGTIWFEAESGIWSMVLGCGGVRVGCIHANVVQAGVLG